MSSTTRTVTAHDGTTILVRHWESVRGPWAGLLLVHGLAEHSGRYEQVGDWMASAGLDVVSYDLRGFGASGGRRAWVERWSDFHDDLEERLAELRAAAPGRPLAFYGHSLGALIACGYVTATPARPLPDALILSAPAIADTIPRWQHALAAALNRVMPTFELKNPFDGSILSRDPSIAERYVEDPLNYHASTAHLAVLGFAEQDRVRASLGRLSIPTLVIHGGDDRLVPTATSEPFAALANVTRRVYPHLRHETHNEPEGEQVVADAVTWLHSVLDSRSN